MYESLKVLDEIRLNFSSEGILVLYLTLAFIMFGVALQIKPEHFKSIWHNKRLPFIGFVSQFLLLPAVTFILIVIFNRFITPAVAMGMILVASCPGGNVSNFISALARGNAALSVTLTAIATISAMLLTPLNFMIWGGLYTRYISMINADSLLRELEIHPVYVFETVIILLGIPLLLGMLFNHYFRKLTLKITGPVKTISIVIFAAILVIMFRSNYEYFLRYIHLIFIIVLVHNGIALLSGYMFSSAFHCGEADKRTITIETGIQNSGLALALLFNPKIFPVDLANGGMAFIAAWWGIWHILAGLTIAGIWSKRKPKD
ncbi:MAG: bile acid:sodium symporter family protein [Bacteroidales bacterium]|nr:bile acid:sodium symporter family protein [Bacteroidales bacterium]